MDHLFTMFTTPGFTDEQIHVFLASGLTRGSPHREVDEFMTRSRVPFDYTVEDFQSDETTSRYLKETRSKETQGR